jgi:hypothetical protein
MHTVKSGIIVLGGKGIVQRILRGVDTNTMLK